MTEKINVKVKVTGENKPISPIEVGSRIGVSFMELMDEELCGIAPVGTFSNGTSVYHYYPFFKFVWTDGVSEFVKEHESVWLLTMVQSYLQSISTMYVEIKNGEVNFKEFGSKNKDADDFQIIFFHKTGEKEGYFSVENDNGEMTKTQILQYIPFTDLDVDCVKLYLYNGVLMFPSEY